MFTQSLTSQIGFFGENTLALVRFIPCGDADTLSIKITGITNQTNVFLSIKLPNNAVHHGLISGGTTSFINTDSLRVNIGTLNAGQVVTINYLVGLNCNTLINGSFNVNYFTTSTTHTNSYLGQSYAASIYIPILQFLANDIDSSGLVLGSVHTRKYKIANVSTNSISYFDTIIFKSKYKPGEILQSLTIGSNTYTPPMTGDSLVFIISGLNLDTDGKLNGGQFINIEEKVAINNLCLINNNLIDTSRAYWGCYNLKSCIAHKILTPISQVTMPPPQNLVATHINKKSNSCLGIGYDTFQFTIKNLLGAGVAKNINFSLSVGHINQVIPVAQRLIYYLNNATISATKNGSVYNILKDTLATYGKNYAGYAATLNACPLFKSAIPNSARWGYDFLVDSLLPGDSISVMALYEMPCNKAAQDQYSAYILKNNSREMIGGHTPKISNLASSNFCNMNFTYSYPNNTGIRRIPLNDFQYYLNSFVSANLLGNANFSTGDTNTVNVQIQELFIQQSNFNTNRSRMYVEYDLPTGLKPYTLSPSGYPLGGLIARKVSFISNILRIEYSLPNSVNQGLTAPAVGSFKLLVDCSAISNAKLDSISTNVYYNPDTNCTSCLPLLIGRFSNYNVSLHCPSSFPNGGFKYANFDRKRYSVGLADYDNNGVPDGTSKAVKDSVRNDLFINGDTIHVKQQGTVSITGTSPASGFTNGYAIHKFKFENLGYSADSNWFVPIFSSLKIYDKSTSSVYVFNTISTDRIVYTSDSVIFIYDLSHTAIQGKGTIPASYTYAQDDSISLEVFYNFMPPLNRQEINFGMNETYEIYLSNTILNRTSSSTIQAHSRYVNDVPFSNSSLMFVPSQRFGWPGGNVFESSICNASLKDVRYYQLNMGTYGTQYNTNLYFKNEYRPLGMPGKLYTFIPKKGIRVDSMIYERLSTNMSPLIGAGPYTIPPAFWKVFPDSGLIEIDGNAVYNFLYSVGKQADEGVQFALSHFYTRTGPASAYNPVLPGFNLSKNEWKPTNAPWINNIPYSPHLSQFGNNSPYLRYANPNLYANYVGFSSKTIQGNSTYFDVDLVNDIAPIDMIIDSVWVYFKPHGGNYKLDSVINNATGYKFSIANGRLIKIGIMSLGLTRNLRVHVSSNSNICFKDSFSLYYGWNCAMTKSPISDVELDKFLIHDTTTHIISKYNPVLESKISTSRSTDIDLCDTLQISNIVANVSAENAFDIDYEIYLPNIGAGLNFMPGSFKLYYPYNSSTSVSIPSPVYMGAGIYKWNRITQYIPKLDSGGLSPNTDTIKSKLKLDFILRLSCGYYSGLTISGISKSKCGSSTTFTYTNPLRLNAEKKVTQQFYNFYTEPDSIYTCGIDSLNRLKSIFTNISSSANPTGAFDSVFIVLPPGIIYNSAINSSPRAPDVVTNLSDGTQRLSWNIGGTNQGNSVVFNYGIKSQDSISCLDPKSILSRAVTFVLDTCIFDGSTCYSGVIKGENYSTLSIFKPKFIINNITATSIPSGLNSELVSFNYTIQNTGNISNKHIVKWIEDKDNNGYYNLGDTNLYIDTFYTVLSKNQTNTRQISKLISSQKICNLVLEIDSNNCQCSRSSILIPTPKLKNLGNDTFLCSNESKSIGSNFLMTNYTYFWSPSIYLSNSNSINPSFSFDNTLLIDSIHTYILNSSRPLGCSSDDTIKIKVFPKLILNSGGNKTVCQNTTAISMGGTPTALNGKSPYTFLWTPSLNLSNNVISNPILFTSIPMNSYYKLIVTDANNCKYEDSSLIRIDSTPKVDAGNDQIICMNSPTFIGKNAIVGLKYTWSPKLYLNDSSIAKPIFLSSSIGTKYYALKVEDISTKCFAFDTVSVTTRNIPIADAGANFRVCKNTMNITLGATPAASSGSPPYNYIWTPNLNLNFNNIEHPIINPNMEGSVLYMLQVFDSIGCVSYDTVLVTIDSLPSVNAGRDTNLCMMKSTIIGSMATSNISYLWSPSIYLSDSTSASTLWVGLGPGIFNYILKATNTLSGCSQSDTVRIQSYPLPSDNAGTDKTRVNCIKDSVQIGTGNNSNYQYSWTPNVNLTSTNIGNPKVTPIVPMSYYLYIRDKITQCETRDTVNITIVGDSMITTKNLFDLNCYNDASGKVVVIPSKGYTPYLFNFNNNGNSLSNTASNLSVGKGYYVVTDNKGCERKDSFNLTQPDSLDLKLVSSKDITCFNKKDGEIVVSVNGGIPSYTYSWSTNPSTTNTANNLDAGLHTVNILDNNLCKISTTIELKQPQKLEVKSNLINNKCYGETKAQISVIANYGTPPYVYQWSSGGNKDTISNISFGTYDLTIMDKNLCEEKMSYTIIDPLKIIIDTVYTKDLTCDNKINGSLKIIAKGGKGKLQYKINASPFSFENLFFPLDSGEYKIAVRDENLCQVATSKVLTKQDKLIFEILPKDTTIDLNSSVELKTNILQGNKSWISSMYWEPSEGLSCGDCENPIATTYTSRIYTLFIKYLEGCEASSAATIKVKFDEELYIPNSFAPASNNIENKTFKIYSNQIKLAHLIVWNRWGEKVFETMNGTQEGWNGIYKNTEAPVGVYYYSLDAEYLNRARIVRKGTINLIR